MSVGAAQKQTMHRDDRDWRGWRGGGGQQILESRPLYIPTRPKNRGKGQGLFLPWPGQAGGWDD